jgi:glycosyltransferase involved in cell wall biosynthesis
MAMDRTALCMLAPEFLPVWGGTGSYTVELIKSLPKNVDIDVITLRRNIDGMAKANRKDASVESILKRQVNVHYLSESHETFFYNFAFQSACFLRVPQISKKINFDIIHSHLAHMPDVYLQLFRQTNIPTVVTLHGTIQMLRDHAIIARDLFHDLEAGEKSILRFYPVIRKLQDFYARRVSHFIAVSKITKELAINHLGVEPSKISLVYNGVDPDLFHMPDEDELNKRNSDFTIVYIGRIISKKGIDILVRAMPEILKFFPKARFIFVGGGNVSFYKEMIESQGISVNNYSFTGHMGYLERSKIMREATVFVNPSFFENCSISILEAMSSGCSVVAGNVGGNPELIQSGRNGLLVPPFDHVALAKSIVSLLCDESENRLLGKMARMTVEESFTSKKCAEETYKVYKKTISNE